MTVDSGQLTVDRRQCTVDSGTDRSRTRTSPKIPDSSCPLSLLPSHTIPSKFLSLFFPLVLLYTGLFWKEPFNEYYSCVFFLFFFVTSFHNNCISSSGGGWWCVCPAFSHPGPFHNPCITFQMCWVIPHQKYPGVFLSGFCRVITGEGDT